MLKFFAEKMWDIFSAKNIGILYIESPKTVNEITLNELVNDALNNWALPFISCQKSHFKPQYPFIKMPQLRYFNNKLTTAWKASFIVVMLDQAGMKHCPFYVYCNNPKCWDRQVWATV